MYIYRILKGRGDSTENSRLMDACSDKALVCAKRDVLREANPEALSDLEAKYACCMNDTCFSALQALFDRIMTCQQDILEIEANFKSEQGKWQDEHAKVQQLSSEQAQTQTRHEATARRVLSLQEEKRNLRGLFSGKRRRELEEAVEKEKLTLRQIDSN